MFQQLVHSVMMTMMMMMVHSDDDEVKFLKSLSPKQKKKLLK